MAQVWPAFWNLPFACTVHGVSVLLSAIVLDGRDERVIVMLLCHRCAGNAALSRANVPDFVPDLFSEMSAPMAWAWLAFWNLPFP